MTESSRFYAHYQEWKSWDDMFIYSSDHAGYLRAELADFAVNGANVLEIGFGSGSCVAWLAKQGAIVSVTEVSERSCSAARARGYEVLPSDLPSVADDYAERFDTIIAFDVFEHFELDAVQLYLVACAKILRSGGRMILRFPNAQSPFGLMPQAGDPTHKSQLCLSVLELMIVNQPYRVVRYASSYMYLGKWMTPVWFKRIIRRSLQKATSAILNFIYAASIPYEPVVVIVLEKV
jgi:2-polyprenyl-3-methyl-5-hydroxy-6-metoxy-1,4-benzoquinol methylase